MDSNHLLMSSRINLPHVEELHIAEIQIGSELINLGKLIEKEETDYEFVLIILITNIKHVFRFEKNKKLYILVSDIMV